MEVVKTYSLYTKCRNCLKETVRQIPFGYDVTDGNTRGLFLKGEAITCTNCGSSNVYRSEGPS